MSLHVMLAPEHAKLVDDLVSSGRYASREEVIRDSLSLLQRREEKSAELRQTIEEGLRSVEDGRLLTIEEAFGPAYARLGKMAPK